MGKKTDIKKYSVHAEDLRWICDPETFPFSCTSDIQALKEFIGQHRAISSINFGLGIERPGYNLFLTGLAGTGKASTIQASIEKFIAEKKSSGAMFEIYDWCYVHNFKDPDRPRAIKLPNGLARPFREKMEELLKRIKDSLTKAFGGEEYGRLKQEALEDHQRQYQQDMDTITNEAHERKLVVQLQPEGASIIPLVEGIPLPREKFLSLTPTEREGIEEKRKDMLRLIDDAYKRIRERAKAFGEKMEKLKLKTGESAISDPFEELAASYRNQPAVTDFLADVKEYTLKNLELFSGAQAPQHQLPFMSQPPQNDPFIVYKVNVFIDNALHSDPPIKVETNPNWFNMFGRIERKAFMGAYVSDHTMIKPGTVHTANGGYLILGIRDILMNPWVWEGLKRVIKTKELRVEDPLEQLSFFAPMGMRPEPIPVNLKIVVMGEERVYQALSFYDEDFWEMFKVKADFDHRIERTEENMNAYACFIAGCCDREGLLPFDRTAIAKVMEYAVREADDKEKLSARFGVIKDLLVETDNWARISGSATISGEHVEKSVRENIHRLDLTAERIRNMIGEGTIMIDLDTEVVGQVNGLSVHDTGVFRFGSPSRITAKTFLGMQGVINIERESQLSGRIHDKGVLILSGYLGWKYAQDKPLTLTASLCFEQSYSGVEGDSASSTELYAILSSLSEVPLRQYIAVTGSVNQRGEIQPIGGVNEKIEGFFDVCRIKGLTGKQGVLIPSLNIRHLMLRDDVVGAVREGAFHIYAAKTIDEGIEILTGLGAGRRLSGGSYSKGSVNALVAHRLRKLAEDAKKFYRPLK
ncbi:MAG: ATP-binding protein [Nitrospirae bacterium]|nr:MAG: ATP-binding protein [Nitrospirota bacterium]